MYSVSRYSVPFTRAEPLGGTLRVSSFDLVRINGMSGFPHSEICGSKVAHTSPQLIAACHVLHRLYAPRHPRIALTSRLRAHTTNINAAHSAKSTANAQVIGRHAQRMPPTTQLVRDNNLSQCIKRECTALPGDPAASQPRSPTQSRHLAASILRTHSQCQRGASRSQYRGFSPRISYLHQSGNVSRLRVVSRGQAAPYGALACAARAHCRSRWWSLSGSNR